MGPAKTATCDPQDFLAECHPVAYAVATEVVSRTLWHKHPATTQAIYQHAVPELEEEAISQFAALLERAESA